jgi:hypothetical protein
MVLLPSFRGLIHSPFVVAGASLRSILTKLFVISFYGVFMLRRSIAFLLVCVFLVPSAIAGVGSKNAVYIGGTVNSIKEGTEGVTSAKDEKQYSFKSKGGDISIPYDRVDSLEYGQKAGRRLGLALTISPWLLLSKKRKHFLTISWKDEADKQQAAVLELGKDVIRTELATLEARTGRKIEYQDDEARKSGRGN